MSGYLLSEFPQQDTTLGKSQTTCPGSFSMNLPNESYMCIQEKTTCQGKYLMSLPDEMPLSEEARQLVQVTAWGLSLMTYHCQGKLDNLSV